ncbi:MAG: hypothetical protein Q9167_005500 [Letrouitia subvulpina]
MLRNSRVKPPPFTAHDWEDNGWNVAVDEEKPFEPEYPQLTKAMKERGISVSNEDNLYIEASVEWPFRNIRGKLIDPQAEMPQEYMGLYGSRYNFHSGAILAEQSFSPTFDVSDSFSTLTDQQVREAVPPLNRWSDVTWTIWSHFAENPANLRYIIRENIVNSETCDIIDHALDYAPIDEETERTYDIDSEDGKALLGTPNGGGTAWLLKAGMSVLGRRDPRVTAMITNEYYTMIWDLGD